VTSAFLIAASAAILLGHGVIDFSKFGLELVGAFDVRRRLRVISRIIALAVVAASSATFAQPASPPTAEDALQERIAQIAKTQGGNSADLIEPLTALSLLYEERGDYAVAQALIEEVTQVVEVNYGLHTLDEAQLMRRTIRIERAGGNAEAAWNEEQELLRLIRRRRHQADARTVPILQEIADQRRAILARYEAGEFPPEIFLGCYYSEWEADASGNPRRTGCGSGSRSTVIRALRTEAAGFDSEAAAVTGRLRRWIELPCAKPEASAVADERRSKQSAKEEMQAYFHSVSDYAGCTQAKYDHAASANASQEELSQLASDKNAAAAELAAQTAIYNERFGR
jgi:hypothetical protein